MRFPFVHVGYNISVMHELSIALSLISAATQAAREAGAGSVLGLRVRVGVLAAVDEDALRFSFALASEGTALEGATLTIESVPAAGWCPVCHREVEIQSIQAIRCPSCATPLPHLAHGRELELTSLEIIEGEPIHDGAVR